ncbi:MAG: GPW/gp25 family protein [Prevotellaceae bacterium]|jgi:phage baseplate assembly protein W|nr:GPW/gp25 family protein [Prevotellaceae bacterium]
MNTNTNISHSILNSQFSTFNYLGKGWSFPPAFIKGYGAEMAAGEEDIRQSLTILFSTVPGERIFRFDYGCDVCRWVFEKMDLSVETLIIDSIKQAILYFEPRIETEKISIESKDPQKGILWINIDYTLRSTNSRSNMVYPFYFKEGTNL